MCVVWCGVVWCGVVWCGVVWCALAYENTISVCDLSVVCIYMYPLSVIAFFFSLLVSVFVLHV